MRARTLYEHDGRRTIVAVYETGDELPGGLELLCLDEDLDASSFSAIGAFRRATLGYFDWSIKDYRKIDVDEQVEVVSLAGNITRLESGEPKVHAHAVVGTREGDARCGHLLSAEVRPTLEVVVEESPGHLRRRHDPETGLALIYLAP